MTKNSEFEKGKVESRVSDFRALTSLKLLSLRVDILHVKDIFEQHLVGDCNNTFRLNLPPSRSLQTITKFLLFDKMPHFETTHVPSSVS